MEAAGVSELDKKIIRALQGEFPLVAEPYKELAAGIGISEDLFLQRVRAMEEEKKIRAGYAGRILEVIPIASDEKEETLAAMTAVVAEAESDDLPGNARRRQIGESLYILTLDKATGRPLRLMWDYSPLMQEVMKQQLSPGTGSGEVPDRQALETDAFIHSISMLCTVDFAYDSNTVITVPGEALLAPEKEAETPFLNPFGMHEGSVLQSL